MIGSSEKSIFLSALEHERSADRDAYVREACGDDPQLRVAVEGLLAAHERPVNPLDHVPEAVSPLRLRLEIAEGIRPETTARTI